MDFFFCRVIDGDSIAHVGFAVVLRDHDQSMAFSCCARCGA